MNSDNEIPKGLDLVTPPGFYVKAYRKLIEQFDYKTSLVYGHVHDYCRSVDKETGEVINECWRAAPGLAADLGMERKTVKNSLDALVESGWLTRERRPGKTSIYRIPQAIPISTLPKNGMTTLSENGRGTPTKNGVLTESLTNKTTTKEVVVNSDAKEIEALELHAAKNPRIKSPKAWAKAMNDKGITLEQVASQKTRVTKHKKATEEERQEVFRRSFEEVNQTED